MKNILLTGGAGFIGCHTCLILLERGFNVVVYDSFINSSPNSLKNVKKIFTQQNPKNKGNLHVIKGDISDSYKLNQVFTKAKETYDSIDGVIHFAGLKSVRESVKRPIKYWENNVNGTINLLKIMELHDCNTIVFSSSATIYGSCASGLLSENSIINPVNPYGATKLSIEKFLLDIFNSSPNKWRIANLRYFNPIGAHSSGLIGEDCKDEMNNIFPLILEVASGRKKELEVFGNDWPTPDGTCLRDYVHVMDLSEGHINALNYLFKNVPKIINLNLGTGIGTSVLELINTFGTINKVDIPYKVTPRREGDVAMLVADNSLSREILNWQPKRNLELMCQDGWNWKLKYPDGF